MVAEDAATNRFGRPIATRFPPEPNGFPHIGHVKSICLNFGIAQEFGGRCNLRFDDTNPFTEDIKYVEAIKRDVEWLGFEWDAELYASDYFEQLYEIAEDLVKRGKAYVDSQTEEEIRENRGTVTDAGNARPVSRSLARGEPRPAAPHEGGRVPRRRARAAREDRPRAPEHDHARSAAAADPPRAALPARRRVVPLSAVRLRARAVRRDRRDHALALHARVQGQPRHLRLARARGGFERPPEQTEFARLELDYTVLSKRKLLRLVNEGRVSGWDDPRMPTIAGMRRRGVTPEGLRDFAEAIGVARKPARTELATFEHAIRDDLNMRVPRVMCVRRTRSRSCSRTIPKDRSRSSTRRTTRTTCRSPGSRKVPFSRELWIERDDFMEDPPKKFFRLAPGREVRLRYGYFITCTDVVKDAAGQRRRAALHVRSGDARRRRPRRPEGAGHDPLGVGAARARCRGAALRQAVHGARPRGAWARGRTSRRSLNPDSLVVVPGAKIEPSVREATRSGTRYQFERTGYFISDTVDSTAGAPRVQPHGDAAGQLGEGERRGTAGRPMSASTSDGCFGGARMSLSEVAVSARAAALALGSCHRARVGRCPPSSAQVVRGLVTERTTNAPLDGVLLSVLDRARLGRRPGPEQRRRAATRSGSRCRHVHDRCEAHRRRTR